ncbi:hypothetical protein OIU79_010312 [Salix purpurea]|uniref:Uncharacterized protein n=1 Tax=Salix purpurea TaxID=77065 RepID=A0A9Q0QGF2_SALPP|nr:hypothetical protein OIU79_010312 [Salix purpurea]
MRSTTRFMGFLIEQFQGGQTHFITDRYSFGYYPYICVHQLYTYLFAAYRPIYYLHFFLTFFLFQRCIIDLQLGKIGNFDRSVFRKRREEFSEREPVFLRSFSM